MESGRAPDVGKFLARQLDKLQGLHAHRVDEEPAGNVERNVRAEIVAEVLHHPLVDLRDHKEVDGLTTTNAPHTVGSLGIITERHVLTDGDGGLGVGRLLDVHSSGVDLVVERETTVGVETTLIEEDRATALAQEDHLAIVSVEVDHAFHPLGEVLEEVVGDFFVVHSSDQGTCVDECVVTTRERNLFKQQLGVPVLLDELSSRDEARCQDVDDLAITSGLVLTVAKIKGQKVAGCSREADALAKEDVASELVTAGADLELLEVHARGEDVLAEVVVDDFGQQADDTKELAKLLGIVGLEQRQREDTVGTVDLVGSGDLQPLTKERAGWTEITGSSLATVVLLELHDDAFEIRHAQTFVAVGEHSETDERVGMGKLRRATGHVFADKRHGHEETTLRRAWVKEHHVSGVEDTIGDTVDLGEDVREERRDPVSRKVEQLLGLRKQLSLNNLESAGVTGSLDVIEEHRVGDLDVAHKVLVEPEQCPLGHEGPELDVVEGLVEQNQVRSVLEGMCLESLVDDLADLLDECIMIDANLLADILELVSVECEL